MRINETREKIFRNKEHVSQLMKHSFRIRQLKNVLKYAFKKVKKTEILNSRISIQIRADKIKNLMEESAKGSSKKSKKFVLISPSLKDNAHKMEIKWFSRIN